MVADALGVGVSTVKRWTGQGLLKAVKTLGGHRRYRIQDIYEFAWELDLPTDSLPPLPALQIALEEDASAFDTLLRALLEGDRAVADALIARDLANSGDRVLVLDQLIGAVMRRIGELWDEGEVGVDEEHRATKILEEVLSRQSTMRIHSPAGVALLGCPPTEHHDLPLRFVKLTLEWNRWEVHDLGANVPWESLMHMLSALQPDLLLLSARSRTFFDSMEFQDVLIFCESLGVEVAVGGSWARGGPEEERNYLRFRTLKGFDAFLKRRTRNG